MSSDLDCSLSKSHNILRSPPTLQRKEDVSSDVQGGPKVGV